MYHKPQTKLFPTNLASSDVMLPTRIEVKTLKLNLKNILLLLIWASSKNIEKGRSLSCYIALCAKSVGVLTPTVASHSTVNEMQLLGFDNLCFYAFKGDPCLEKCYLIYPVTITHQFNHKM